MKEEDSQNNHVKKLIIDIRLIYKAINTPVKFL